MLNLVLEFENAFLIESFARLISSGVKELRELAGVV